MLARLFFSTLALLAACSGSAPLPADTLDRTIVASSNRIMKGSSRAFDTTAAYRLVSEYVHRDAAGERLRSTPWFDTVIVRADEEPGYDSFTAIRSYALSPADPHGDTTGVLVKYSIIGLVEQKIEGDSTAGMLIVPRDTTEVVFYPVVQTARGWKIVSPQVDPRVLPSAILTSTSLPPLSEADRQWLTRYLSPGR
jgi:hypothetical protein